MEFSSYQAAIFEWIKTGRGHAVVNAVAGSGKTTTLVACCERLSGKALFCAFNKHIEQALSSRLPGTTVKTIHSLGYSLIRGRVGRLRVDDRKVYELTDTPARDLERRLLKSAKRNGMDVPEASQISEWLRKLIHFARVTLSPLTLDGLEGMADYYGLDLAEDERVRTPLLKLVAGLLERCADMAERGWIDYDDMIWLPSLWDLHGETFDWVMVDEAQDLSNAQRDVVERHIGAGGRSLWVGDPAQSIQGFAGADPESFDRIQQAFEAVSLPLSICYRCPPNHLELARDIVPQIEAAPGKAEGPLEWIGEEAIQGMVQEGDMILSRWTAPAVSLCLRLIAAKIPARVRGRDIGKGLAATVREIAARDGYTWALFASSAEGLKAEKIAKIEARKGDHETQIAALSDRFDAIEVCRQAFGVTSAEGLCSAIQDLFSDERRSVTLSTIHRSKGLEADRVFVLGADKLPVVWKRQKGWEAWQEECCHYVALTRSRRELYLVTSEKKKEE